MTINTKPIKARYNYPVDAPRGQGVEHVPTHETREIVRALSVAGYPHDEIANYLQLNKKALHKYYTRELSDAVLVANLNVSKFLLRLASGQALADGATYADCKTAAIFWAKTRLGWRETTHHEVSGGVKLEITVEREDLDL